MEIEDFYFASLVGWTYHPGYKEKNRPTLDELADLVEQMVKTRNERWPQLSEQA